MAETVVPGGRVELPTPAFSGPRSTGELPRHFGRQEIVRGLRVSRKRPKNRIAMSFEKMVEKIGDQGHHRARDYKHLYYKNHFL